MDCTWDAPVSHGAAFLMGLDAGEVGLSAAAIGLPVVLARKRAVRDARSSSELFDSSLLVAAGHGSEALRTALRLED